MSGTGNIGRVEAFVDAWNRRDGEAITAAFADDAVYHNVPMAPIVGNPAISAAIVRLVSGMSDVAWEIVHIAEGRNGTVLTERVDALRMADRSVSLPLMGVFEFRCGLITRWADYFDLGQYQAQLAGNVAGGLA